MGYRIDRKTSSEGNQNLIMNVIDTKNPSQQNMRGQLVLNKFKD
jgi:hypothetical protein